MEIFYFILICINHINHSNKCNLWQVWFTDSRRGKMKSHIKAVHRDGGFLDQVWPSLLWANCEARAVKPPSLWTALIWLFIFPLLTVSKPHLSKLLLEPNFTICPSASFPKIPKYYQNFIKQFIIFIFLVKSSYNRTTTSVEPSKVCHPNITVGKSSFMNSSYMFSKLLFISVVFPANIT